jgi:mono/diheme cytochrome c family protein
MRQRRLVRARISAWPAVCDQVWPHGGTALASGVAASALMILVGGALLAAQEASESPAYTVIDGKADPDTANGYMIYTAKCMPCHGPDGLGSSFAPSLVQAAERRTFAEFTQTVRAGRSLLPGRIMPGFADDEQVMAHIDDIWRYLQARADGALGRGRPEVLEVGDQPAADARSELAEPERRDDGDR